MGRLHSATNLDTSIATAEFASMTVTEPATTTGVLIGTNIVVEIEGVDHPTNANYIGYPDIDKMCTSDSGTNNVLKQHSAPAVEDGWGILYETDTNDIIQNVALSYASGYTLANASASTTTPPVRVSFNPYGNTNTKLDRATDHAFRLNPTLPVIWVNKGGITPAVGGGGSGD